MMMRILHLGGKGEKKICFKDSFLAVAIVAVSIAAGFRLLKIQIVDGESYLAQSLQATQ